MVQNVYQEPVQPPMPAPVEVMPAFPEDEPEVVYDETPERFPAYSVKPPSVEERLQKMIDKSLEDVRTRDARVEASKADAKRAIDAKTLPIIVEDQRKAIEHQRMLEGKIEETMAAMSGAKAPQMQRRELGVGQMLALAAAQLMGGGGRAMNQGFGQFTADNREADKMDYANQSAQFELDQSQRELLLRYLTGQRGDVRGDVDRLQEREWNLQDRDAAEEAKKHDPSTLWALYERANTPGEKRIYGAELMRRGVPIKQETIEADAAYLERQQAEAADAKAFGNKVKLFNMLKPGYDKDREAELYEFIFGKLPDNVAAGMAGLGYSELKAQVDIALRESQKTGQDLKNRKLGIDLEYERRLKELEVQGKREAVAFVKAKREQYPQYLAALAGSRAIRDFSALAGVNNQTFDNIARAWEMTTGKEIADLKDQKAAKSKELAEMDTQMAVETNIEKLGELTVKRRDLALDIDDIEKEIKAKQASAPVPPMADTSTIGRPNDPMRVDFSGGQAVVIPPNIKAEADRRAGRNTKQKTKPQPRQQAKTPVKGATTFQGRVDGANVKVTVRKKQ